MDSMGMCVVIHGKLLGLSSICHDDDLELRENFRGEFFGPENIDRDISVQFSDSIESCFISWFADIGFS
jgi:hypothetical protein